MKQDYLNQVLPPEQPPVAADQLPPGAEIRQAEREATAIHDATDMISFTDDEREQVGPASTPEELELNRKYAALTVEFPFLMKLVGRPEEAMRDGYEMERALHIYREANQSLLEASRGTLLISAAELTRLNDDTEDAAEALGKSDKVAPERRSVIGNVARSLDTLRETQKEAQTRRKLRQERKQARIQAALLLSEKRQDRTRKLAELSEAPLPALQSKK